MLSLPERLLADYDCTQTSIVFEITGISLSVRLWEHDFQRQKCEVEVLKRMVCVGSLAVAAAAGMGSAVFTV